jgi:hypothetical protein
MLNQRQIERVNAVINDPAHGAEFYTEEMHQDLLYKIEEILDSLDINENTPEEDVIVAVNNYLKENVSIRHEYFYAFREVVNEFPQEELKYRTAYAALCEGQAMCAAYAEAARVLLESCGFRTHTLLSKLPGTNKQLLHYVTVVEYKAHGREHFVFDPEREKNCDSKGFDFREYLLKMTYIKPESYFYKNKIGPTGVGPKADYYIAKVRPAMVVGKNEVGKLFEDQVQLGEEE